MDSHAYYEYKILEHLEESPFITHRMAANKLGVSVRLTHAVVRKLIRRGWIHARRRDGRSLHYFLTPKGIGEKVRLTYEFLQFTQEFYREARRRSSEACRRLAEDGVKRIGFLGCGDLAEIAYLGVVEHKLQLTRVFDAARAGETFMGGEVVPAADIPKSRAGRRGCERVLVTAYDPGRPMGERYLPEGIEADDRFVWVFDRQELVKEIRERAPAPGPKGAGKGVKRWDATKPE